MGFIHAIIRRSSARDLDRRGAQAPRLATGHRGKGKPVAMVGTRRASQEFLRYQKVARVSPTLSKAATQTAASEFIKRPMTTPPGREWPICRVFGDENVILVAIKGLNVIAVLRAMTSQETRGSAQLENAVATDNLLFE
jgi:hypothetical protein